MSLSALLFALLPAAFADDATTYTSALAEAQKALLAKDYKAAADVLDDAEALAPASTALLPEADLARLPFYRGVVEWYAGDRDGAALDWWRKALVVAPAYTPNADVLPETEAQDVFYALLNEQKGKEQIALGLPEDPGEATIFVDGKRFEPLDSVYLGRHFIQIRCPEGNLTGSWYTFGSPPPDYLVLCTGGGYPAEKGGKAAKAPKAPRAEKPPKEEKAPKEEKEPSEGGGDTLGWVVAGVGGAMIAGGAGVNFLMVNPAWFEAQAAIENPGSVTEEQAAEIEDRFNTGRYLTIGMIGGGAVLLGTGLLIGPLLDGSGSGPGFGPRLGVGIGPGTLLLSGSF